MNSLRSLYLRADATELAEKLRQREISSRELIQVAIDEIERQNPGLNAVIYQMYESAKSQAEKRLSGPFAGVPLLLKDDSDVAGTSGTQACAALKDEPATADSDFVRRLREAGFIFLGKTNLPEWGLKNITEPKLHGPCRNPHNPDYSPGGSSGGSGAAVAGGMVPIATGSDGAGSIRIPSSYCGLVGLKASRGRISTGPKHREGWEGFGTYGALTRSVRDAAAFLDQVSGYQPGSPYSCMTPERPFAESIRSAPEKLRIAFSVDIPGIDVAPQAVEATRQAARTLASLGHHLEEVQPPVDISKFMNAFMMVCFIAVSGEAARIKAQYGRAALRRIELDSRVFAEIGNWTKLSELYAIRQLWQKMAYTMAEFHQTYSIYMTPTTATAPSRIGELEISVLEKVGLKLAFAIRGGWLLKRLPLVKQQIYNNFKRTPLNVLANITGQPAISLPLYYDERSHLPWGVQFFAGYGQEATLLQIAAQLEQTSIWQYRLATPPTRA